MSEYLCYYLNSDGSVPAFDTLEAANADEALRIGAGLLQRAPERAALEIWSGDARISTLLRSDAKA